MILYIFFLMKKKIKSRVEKIDNPKLVPNSIKSKNRIYYSLLLRNKFDDSFIKLFINKDTFKTLCNDLCRAIYIYQDSTIDITNIIGQTERYLYSNILNLLNKDIIYNIISTVFNINTLGCKLDIIPNIKDIGKVKSVTITAKVYYKGFIMKHYSKYIQPKVLEISKEDIENLLFIIKYRG